VGRILVVVGPQGDAGEIASHLSASRTLAGHEVEVRSGAIETLRALRRRAYDVVVTDPARPLRDDLALAEEIRQLDPGCRTILLAPSAAPEDVIAAVRQHAFAYFSAPFDHREIADMVAVALREERWRDGIQLISATPHWIQLRVACRLLTAERLIRFMTELRSDVPDDDRFLLMAAFREMLINAMEHGAGFDPEKVVEVTAVRTKRTIVYHFRDPGPGFDPGDLAHAAASTRPDDVLAATERREDLGRRPGGFGMLLVKQIVDELMYSERGNEVLMIKHLA
jgi:anti-sigma regulatory factor (Ser/Thr protein kinase)/CheY-like chemotaxis protein